MLQTYGKLNIFERLTRSFNSRKGWVKLYISFKPKSISEEEE